MPATIAEAQAALDDCLAAYLPKPEVSNAIGNSEPQPVGLDDQEIVDFIRDKYADLWAGRWGLEYGTHSEADLALCSRLAWVTGNDRSRIDRIFRSSGLMRDKWDRLDTKGRPDYRELTIEAAIRGTSEKLSQNVVPTLEPPESSLLETRGVPTDVMGELGLGAIVEAFDELLVMPDPGAVEIALASVVANYADGDPSGRCSSDPPAAVSRRSSPR